MVAASKDNNVLDVLPPYSVVNNTTHLYRGKTTRFRYDVLDVLPHVLPPHNVLPGNTFLGYPFKGRI